MIDTAVVCLETKAGWSQDIVMERIWWEEIRMNASDFRGETPIPGSGEIIRTFWHLQVNSMAIMDFY